MKVSFFIDRPVFSAVLSIVIVIIGIIGLTMLPVDQYPQITPPVVKISASYPGASALTVSQAVATPIEQEINGTPGMLYMESNSSNSGGFSATVTFDVSADADLAAVEIQNRVKLAESRLPAEVIQNGISVEKQAPSQLMTLCLTSSDPKFDEIYLSNFATINGLDVLRRIPGVGRVSNIGSRYYAMQIWAQPDKLANFGLTVQDLQNALKDQNRESAAGELGKQPISGQDITIPITTQGRLSTVNEFEEIVVRANPDGSIVRLRDVARVSLEASSYSTESGMNGKNAAVLGIYTLPGANAVEVAGQVRETMKEISKNFPEGLDYEIPFDITSYISESIHEVYKTLFEALLLVVLVVFLSLQNWRASLVPLIAVPISLIGTFGVMLVLGFSLNLLTLLGLILSIGIVVDDAIVVVEAVGSYMEKEGLSPYEATKKAMRGLTGALIATSLVLAAVFIPVSFLGGITGLLYRQFAITIVVSVLISTVVALTLSPALCALLLRPYINEDGTQKNNFAARFRNSFNAAFDVVVNKYKNAVLFFIKRRWLSWSLLVCSVVVLVLLMNSTKTSLVPDEDQGVLFVNVSTAPGSSLKTTDDVMLRVEERLEAIPQKLHIQKVTGYGLLSGQGNTFGMIVVKLKPWDERTKKEDQVQAVIGQIYARTADIKDATIFAIAPGMIPGYGMGNALDLNVQDKLGTDVNTFFQTTQQYLGALNQRPEISMAYSTFDVRYPQWTVEVDAAKCKRAGITPDAVLSTLSGYYGGQYVSNFNRFSKVYRVMIQSGPEYRMDESSLHNTFVRMANGEMAPLSQFVTLTRSYGAETLSRFNMYNSIAVNAMPAEGYSTGDAIRAVKETAEISLPKGYGYDFGGITREENQQSGTTVIIFGICILMIYLILSALYESFIVPFAVILAVPVGLMGTFLFAKIAGLENNIYLQTGLIMLIGLLAKTAILLTEYAAERRKAGMGLIASAVSAAKARLRPILMTALTMIFGLFPLVVATGVGANGNRSLGTGVVGGMTIGTLALLFIVPALFVTFQWLQERLRPVQSMPPKDWQIEEEMEVSKKEIEEHQSKEK